MTQHSDSSLIIFIKNPRLGKVKTRLAATAGDERALRIYQALLEHTRHLALNLPVRRFLYYSDFIDWNDAWQVDSFEKKVQQGEDLGQRMSHAFQKVLSRSKKAVIIGSDCASLTVSILREAFSALDQAPFVVGPATDGGYYLLGMQTHTPQLFSGIPWSTPQVFPETLQKINDLQAGYHLTPELSDIDYEEDWEKYGWELI